MSALSIADLLARRDDLAEQLDEVKRQLRHARAAAAEMQPGDEIEWTTGYNPPRTVTGIVVAVDGTQEGVTYRVQQRRKSGDFGPVKRLPYGANPRKPV